MSESRTVEQNKHFLRYYTNGQLKKVSFLIRADHLLLLLTAISPLHHSFKEARAGSLLWIMFSKKVRVVARTRSWWTAALLLQGLFDAKKIGVKKINQHINKFFSEKIHRKRVWPT